MEHTLPPPPPPDAPRADTFYADLLRWLARLVCYPLYRPFTHLSRNPRHALAAVVLRSLLMAGLVGILFKLTQHGLLLWALAHRSRFDPPIAVQGAGGRRPRRSPQQRGAKSRPARPHWHPAWRGPDPGP